MKRLVLIVAIISLSVFLFGCAGENDTRKKDVVQIEETLQQKGQDVEKKDSVVYSNSQFGFDFTLPASWKGYETLTDKWEGLSLADGQGQIVVESGPIISIRHPLWTTEKPRQDIPIMVFTIEQWNALQNDQFHIGAAPVRPSELGRNEKYVFALPARYNYAFPAGFEEVEELLKNNPLKAVDSN